MIHEQTQKYKIGINLFKRMIMQIKLEHVGFLTGLIIYYSKISLLYAGLIISGYLMYHLFVSYQELYSVNEKYGILTDKFIASIHDKTDIKETKKMIARYYSDCKYSYYSENSRAYCKILEDTMFAFSINEDDNILNSDIETGYMLEKGTILEIPAETIFQTCDWNDTYDFTQIIIKSKNALKCFSAAGSYYKINGKKKYISDKLIKIKAGTKVTFLKGEFEGLINFKTFQKNNLYPQFILRKGLEGTLI